MNEENMEVDGEFSFKLYISVIQIQNKIKNKIKINETHIAMIVINKGGDGLDLQSKFKSK